MYTNPFQPSPYLLAYPPNASLCKYPHVLYFPKFHNGQQSLDYTQFLYSDLSLRKCQSGEVTDQE